MTKKLGKQTIKFQNPPVILSTASIVGPMEGKGPLGDSFDVVLPDTLYGEASWERAESKMLRECFSIVLNKATLQPNQIDFLFAGDLLNQTISANFAARETPVPFFGLYGACSTMSESLILASMAIDGGFAQYAIAGTSSHHDSAERQYRFPTELGVQRPPTAQWTVTGAGAALLGAQGSGLLVTHATVGKIIDMGMKDANDMGSAMAPAASDTIVQHFQDIGQQPAAYDLIVTGDLASLGKTLTEELVKKEGFDLGDRYSDCGLLIYSPEQDVHAGASGCGCSAVVFCGHIFRAMQAGKYKRVLLVGTGALMSPTSSQQGESIPCIAHAVTIQTLDAFQQGGF